MRLVRTDLTEDEVRPRLHTLVDRLFQAVPAGVGGRGLVSLSREEFTDMLRLGAEWAEGRGFALPGDLDHTEDRGRLAAADPEAVSGRAMERGMPQVGSLGSGNHYLEVQVASEDDIVDAGTAAAFGIDRPGQVAVMLHCGSRGFGHQVASDYLKLFLSTMQKTHGIQVSDRELACAPFESSEGRRYFAAMCCAVNMAYANRQVIIHRVREVFAEVFNRSPEELGMRQVYDVTHNTAKLETHGLGGPPMRLLVHRKGATRALGPGAVELPPAYRAVGQPVIIGGSMETGSYLLAGVETGAATFFTTAHGSGRTMGRRQAKKRFRGSELRKEMGRRGIYIRAVSDSGLAEEAGGAYKDIDEVVNAAALAGTCRPVARLRPIGNIKG
jgi:tRNA-splicing ligase RtcB